MKFHFLKCEERMVKRLFTILLCGLLFESMLAADAWALAPPVLTR
jgi:hypothetical protein